MMFVKNGFLIRTNSMHLPLISLSVCAWVCFSICQFSGQRSTYCMMYSF